MNLELLANLSSPKLQAFIAAHESADVREFLLKTRDVDGVPAGWVANQIQGRQKAKNKLPSWYRTPGILYPPSINLEQCSSEATARYKATLLAGRRAVDLTGGFGVDTFCLSRTFDQVDCVEPDETMFLLAKKNHELLGASTIRHHHTDAETFLKTSREIYDLAYLDPSRRQGAKKVFRLGDCAPNVTSLIEILLKRAKKVLVKSSPLLDLRQAYRELGKVDRFFVLAVENEVRELLIQLGSDKVNEPEIHAVNLDRQGEPTVFEFTWSQEKEAVANYSAVRQFLYEPNAAIMKAGAFKLVGLRYSVDKLAPQSHWYTSDEKKVDFPGRIFHVVELVSLDKKLREKFPGGAVNIISRNHPLTVEQIRKKTGLEEGGSDYLLCTTTSKPVAILAQRIQ